MTFVGVLDPSPPALTIVGMPIVAPDAPGPTFYRLWGIVLDDKTARALRAAIEPEPRIRTRRKRKAWRADRARRARW